MILEDTAGHLFQSILKEYNTIVATNVFDAEDKTDDSIDMAIIDIHLGDGTEAGGFTYLDWVKKHFPKMKTIVITAYDGEVKKIALAKGVDLFLRKPDQTGLSLIDKVKELFSK